MVSLAETTLESQLRRFSPDYLGGLWIFVVQNSGSATTEKRNHNYVNEITQQTLTGGSPIVFQYDGATGASNGTLKDDGTLIYAPLGSSGGGTRDKGGGPTRPYLKLYLPGFGWAAIAFATGCQVLGSLLTLIIMLFAAPMPRHWSLVFRLAVTLPLPILSVVVPAGWLVGTLLWLAPEIRLRPQRNRRTRMVLIRHARIAATIFAGAATVLGAWQCTTFWVASPGSHWPALTAIYHSLFLALEMLEPLYLWWLWSAVLVTGEQRNPSWSGLAVALTWIWPGLSAYGVVTDLFGRWVFPVGKAVSGARPLGLLWGVLWPQWIGLVAGLVAGVASLGVLAAFRQGRETGT